MRTALGQGWKEAFPDPQWRRIWRDAFTPRDANGARPWNTSPPADAAREWKRHGFPPHLAAHLHHRGLTPHRQHIKRAVGRGAAERREDWGPSATHFRATLILAHPHLTSADRDAIIAAGLDLREIARLVDSGTFDPDTVTLVGALR